MLDEQLDKLPTKSTYQNMDKHAILKPSIKEDLRY